jgi:hypothetical protein
MTDSENHSAPWSVVNGSRQQLLVGGAAGLALFLFFFFLISPRIGFAGFGQNSFYLQDYAYHVILTKQFWFDGGGDIYALDFQRRALSVFLGRPAPVAMPVGATPIMLIVWLPFAWAARFSLALSYSLWMTFSVGALFLALWKIFKRSSPPEDRQTLPVVLCGLTVFSLAGVSTMLVGQTAAFAAAAFSLVLYRLTAASPAKSLHPMDWPLVMLVVLSGLKPPYLMIGFGLLWVYGRWREVFFAGTIFLLVLLALTPGLTAGWPASYFKTLQMYGGGEFPEVYGWSIVPHTMNVLRNAISAWTGDGRAAVISSIVSGLVFLTIMVISLFRSIWPPARRPKLAVALVAACLLFAPYLGAYEDLLMIPAFVAVLLTGRTPPFFSAPGLTIAAALFICLLHAVPGLGRNWPWAFWALKFSVLMPMLWYAGGRSADVPSRLRRQTYK